MSTSETANLSVPSRELFVETAYVTDTSRGIPSFPVMFETADVSRPSRGVFAGLVPPLLDQVGQLRDDIVGEVKDKKRRTRSFMRLNES